MPTPKNHPLDVYLLTKRGYIKIQPQNLWIAKGNSREQAQSWHDVFSGFELSELETLTQIKGYKEKARWAWILAGTCAGVSVLGSIVWLYFIV